MTKIFEDVKPGDLITADLFNKMADKIEELFDRVAAIERTATGTISGAIKDMKTKSPLIGARVYAVAGNATYTSTPADNLGNYSITNLLPGIYRVWAEAENFARSQVETVNVISATTSTVNFMLTSAVSMVVVPDVQGVSLAQAISVINQAGLKLGFVLDTHMNVLDPGNPAAASLLVINQSLSAGNPVPVGTVINLFMGVHAAVAIPPIILDIKPNVGKAADEVEIMGMGFGPQKGKVSFSGVDAPDIMEWSGTGVKVKVPAGAAAGTVNVQVTNADGSKSNTFSFTVKTETCTGCTATCTASCTIGCTSGCTSSCTSSCTGMKESMCRYALEGAACIYSQETICKYASETGCIYAKETGCIMAVETGRCAYATEMGVGCIAKETGGCGVSRVMGWEEPGYRPPEYRPPEESIVVKGEEVTVIGAEKTQPEIGVITEGRVKVEPGKAIVASGTEVTVKTADGREVTGTSISSSGMAVQPAVATVEVVDEAGKTVTYGGTLVSAEGSYQKETGITIEKGTEATIMVAGKTYTGKLTQATVIGKERLDMGGAGSGISRLTR